MPKVEMYGDVDFRGHELLSAVIEDYGSDPSSAYDTHLGRVVAYQGDLYVAKTEGTGDNAGKYQFVKLATGGDASAVATEVGYIKTALGWNASSHALDDTTGLSGRVKTVEGAYASKVTVTGQDANYHTKVKVNSEGIVTDVADTTASEIAAVLDAANSGAGTYLAVNGTAAKATQLAAAKSIGLTGGTTAATAASFDGSENVNITVTALDASKLVVGDASAKAPIGVMPTGNAASKLLELGAVIGTNEAVIWDGSKFSGKSIASVYNVKGSVADYAALTAITTKAVGDVYNVVAANGTTPAGTNYVWNGTEWDALGGSISTSGFEETKNKVNSTTFNGSGYTGSDTGYPTTAAVKTALAAKADKVTVDTTGTSATLQAVVVNSDGIVSSKRAVLASDIPDLATSQITGLDTALAGKQATITGAATSIASSDLTASKVLVSDASGKVAASEISTTALGYLDATSSIQTQLNGKVAKNADITAVDSATFLKVAYDAKGLITGSAAVTASDIPALDAAKITSGTFDVARIPSITSSKVSDFDTAADARVNAVMAAQFVDKKLNDTGVTASGNTYTIATATKAYGVMVTDKDSKQVFVDTTVTGSSIILAFGEPITASEFTVSYILKNATS